MNLPLPVKVEKENNSSIFVRLWVEYSIVDEIINSPIDNSQRVELEEIDGSMILQYNMVVSKKIEDFLVANHDKIKVLSPNSLQNKIKKFING